MIVQQIALRNATTQSSPTTAYIVPQVPTTSSASSAFTTSSQTTGPYVLIVWHGEVYSSWDSYTPSAADVYLFVSISIQNHGYDSVPTAQPSGLFRSYYFYLNVDGQQFEPISIDLNGFAGGELPMTGVLNGLTVNGGLAFEIPAHFQSCSLIYVPQNETFNVRYLFFGIYETINSVTTTVITP